MDELVIFAAPAVFWPELLGLFLIFFEKNARKSWAFLPVLAVCLLLAALFFAVLYGASWPELCVLVLLNLAVLFTGNKL
ncbi:MAG: hypothetical protein IKQ96_09560 [Lachnospiraceae bacterium]|nr:hypothetical protein [Lachnospiraceae bacterium]